MDKRVRNGQVRGWSGEEVWSGWVGKWVGGQVRK